MDEELTLKKIIPKENLKIFMMIFVKNHVMNHLILKKRLLNFTPSPKIINYY